jgi:DNA-binding NarL/FixJ family response regulator
MGKKVLIAETREVIRVGLCIIFQNNKNVSEVTSTVSTEELKKHLSSCDFDLAVVNQMLITDMESLPQGRFALLMDELDLNMLKQAYEHKALGVFSVNIAADLLISTLNSTQDSFLVDPVLLPWIMERLSKARKRSDELQLLSPREREVSTLLYEGLDRRTIAMKLHISETTLKTHIKHIARKHEDTRWSQKVLIYQRNLKGS